MASSIKTSVMGLTITVPYHKRSYLNFFTFFIRMAAIGLFAFMPAARAGNQVVAWGAGKVVNTADNNDYGQSIVPVTLTNAVMVAGGWRHSLALNADGTLQGWGDDSLGQSDFPTINDYVAISCGRLHSLALQSDGAVLATGDDYYGQIDVPSGLSNVVAVACGWYHSLALKADGAVVAWGTSTNTADLGTLDNRGQSLVPSGLSNVVAVAGGAWHSLALKSDGTVVAWGAGTVNNPGDGYDFGQSIIPSGLSNVVAISAGATFSLALEANGSLVAWGNNSYGQINIPAGLTNRVVAIAAGGWHNLALTANGTVVAWGAGTGSNTNIDFGQSSVPAGLTNAIQIAGGLLHSLAVVGSGPPATQVNVTNFITTTNGFSLTLPTQNGRVYQLQFKNSLTTNAWQPLPLIAGTGSPLQLTDTNVTTTRFYRVMRW